MLSAADIHHQWYNLSWIDWFTVGGVLLTILGLVLTWFQAKNAADAARAASNAVKKTEQQIRANQLMVLVPQLRYTVTELDSAIESKSSLLARRNLDSWRWQAGSIHGILSGADTTEKRILRSLQQSVGLAATAGGSLLEANTTVAAGCLQARAAMVTACDQLTTWVGRYSTQTTLADEDSA